MANIAKRADGHRRARYRDAHGKEHARHSTERLTPRTGWTRSRPQCRPASTSTPIAARSQSGIGLRVGLTVRRIQSRLRTSVMPTSCASTFSRSGPLCNSSTSRTPTCRRGSRGSRRGARRRRCARFIACFHSSSRRPSGTVDWRGIRQRRSTCRGSSPPSADISRTSRCMQWPRRWRNPAEVSKHRRLDERENRADRLIVLFLAYTGVRFGELAALRGAGWISCGAGPSSPSP